MNSDKKLRIVLIRHGQSISNIDGRLQWLEAPLTEKGIEQTYNLKDFILKFNFDEFFSSDELRAIESAEIFSSFINLPFEKIPLLREKSSGQFGKMLINDVDWSKINGDFLTKKIPGGENIQEVILRANEFLKIVNQFKHGEDILVVSHGTFLRILFCLVFNKNIKEYLLNYELPNASYIVITRNTDGLWELEGSCLIKKEQK